MESKTAELADGILKRCERQRAIETAVSALKQRPKRMPLALGIPSVFWITFLFWHASKDGFMAKIEGKNVLLFDGVLNLVIAALLLASLIITFWPKRQDRLLLLLSEEVLHLKEELKAKEKS